MTDLQTYAERTGIPVSEMLSRSRKQNHVAARQTYWYHLHSKGFGISEIGRIFGFDRVTVYHGVQKIKDLISVGDKYIKPLLKAIEQ
jgi:chromosomal replication initiation ATPase DnaA